MHFYSVQIISHYHKNIQTLILTVVYVEMTGNTKRRRRRYHVDGEDVQTTARQRERRRNRERENMKPKEKSIEEEISVNSKGREYFFEGAHFCSYKF